MRITNFCSHSSLRMGWFASPTPLKINLTEVFVRSCKGLRATDTESILENWYLYNNKPESACNIPAFCFSVAKSKSGVFLYCVRRTVFAYIVKCKTLENTNCWRPGHFCYVATQLMPLSILYFVVFHVYAMPPLQHWTAEQSCVNSLQGTSS